MSSAPPYRQPIDLNQVPSSMEQLAASWRRPKPAPSEPTPEKETSKPMSEGEYRRRRYLPKQIENTRRKLRMLEAEAARYGMFELLASDQEARL